MFCLFCWFERESIAHIVSFIRNWGTYSKWHPKIGMLREQVADDKVLSFPETFLWGAATAAYQVEGAAPGCERFFLVGVLVKKPVVPLYPFFGEGSPILK